MDRDESRRRNCVKYIMGTAPGGTRVRESTGRPIWERTWKILARRIAERDPVNRPLFGITGTRSNAADDERQGQELFEEQGDFEE